MGVSEWDELGRQSTGKNLRIPGVRHSSPAQTTGQWRGKGRTHSLSITCRNLTPYAIFLMTTTNTLVETCKSSKTTELWYLLKHEQSGRGALKQELAACSPLLSLTGHILLPAGGVTQQNKKGWKPTWHKQRPAQIWADSLFISYTSPRAPGPQPHYRLHSS